MALSRFILVICFLFLFLIPFLGGNDVFFDEGSYVPDRV